MIETWDEHDLFFVETPLWRTTSTATPSWRSTRRCRSQPASGSRRATSSRPNGRGRVDVLQPDVGRVGGLTEARRVRELAASTA